MRLTLDARDYFGARLGEDPEVVAWLYDVTGGRLATRAELLDEGRLALYLLLHATTRPAFKGDLYWACPNPECPHAAYGADEILTVRRIVTDAPPRQFLAAFHP